MIAKKDAKPDFNPFNRYRHKQKLWEYLCTIVSQRRYELRKVMEEHNLSNKPIVRDEQGVRQLGTEETIDALQKAFDIKLSKKDWATLAKEFHVKTFFEDEMLFRCGDFNETMYIMLKGEIQLFAGTQETGGEIEIARLHKGDILGESCMANQPFTLNCRALQFTELLGIDKKDIKNLVKNHPELGAKYFQQILMKVVEKVRANNLYSMRMGGGVVKSPFIDGSSQETDEENE